jgi:hypothetical protein
MCCQGELLMCLQVFSAKQRDQAYEMASNLADRTDLVVIVCGKTNYLIGVDLRGRLWQHYYPTLNMPEADFMRKLRLTLRQAPLALR